MRPTTRRPSSPNCKRESSGMQHGMLWFMGAEVLIKKFEQVRSSKRRLDTEMTPRMGLWEHSIPLINLLHLDFFTYNEVLPLNFLIVDDVQGQMRRQTLFHWTICATTRSKTRKKGLRIMVKPLTIWVNQMKTQCLVGSFQHLLRLKTSWL